MSIGERIRSSRQKAKLSQIELASSVGTENNTVSRWERDVMQPSVETVRKLAAALDTSVAYLLGETDDPRRFVLEVWEDEKDPHKIVTIKREVKPDVIPPNLYNLVRIQILSKTNPVCCGRGSEWLDEKIDFDDSLVLADQELANRYSDDDLIGVYADGSSMEPNICADDLVLFAKYDQYVPYAGCPMVVRYNGNMIIRGVIENNSKKLVLRSRNPSEYPDITVTPDDDFVICGRVVKIWPAAKSPESVL